MPKTPHLRIGRTTICMMNHKPRPSITQCHAVTREVTEAGAPPPETAVTKVHHGHDHHDRGLRKRTMRELSDECGRDWLRHG
jgi:hypothetical protein